MSATDKLCWDALDSEQQIQLRIEFGRYLDQLPPTCSLEEKNLRFARWLAERGITYTPDTTERSPQR